MFFTMYLQYEKKNHLQLQLEVKLKVVMCIVIWDIMTILWRICTPAPYMQDKLCQHAT